jgi:hypothetical protein
MRLRRTAPPSLLLTVMPTRFSARPFLRQYTTIKRDAALLPLL